MDARQAKAATARSSRARAKRVRPSAGPSPVRVIDEGSSGRRDHAFARAQRERPRGSTARSTGEASPLVALLSLDERSEIERSGRTGEPPRGGLGLSSEIRPPWAEAAAEQIRATGEVACPLRMGAHVARDRCISNQHGASACRCPTGLVARRVGALEAIEEGAEEARLEKARAAYSSPPETWVLVCGYRGCKETFEVARGWHRKPSYCCGNHGRLEKLARKADRAGVTGG
jgi:hypothetical protein